MIEDFIIEGMTIINVLSNITSMVFTFMVWFILRRVRWLKGFLWGRINMSNANEPFEHFFYG